ncbi:hypothetical protein XPA_010024 [Xanthoria parietina]
MIWWHMVQQISQLLDQETPAKTFHPPFAFCRQTWKQCLTIRVIYSKENMTIPDAICYGLAVLCQHVTLRGFFETDSPITAVASIPHHHLQIFRKLPVSTASESGERMTIQLPLYFCFGPRTDGG